MKTKLISALIIAALSIGINANILASGPFSQSFSNPLNINPAYAGSLGHSRLAFAYRNQFPAIPGNNVLTSISYDHYFPKLSSGFGLIYDYEKQGEGVFKNRSLNAMYAFNIKIKELNIRPAINVGFGNEKYNPDFTFIDPSSIELPDPAGTHNYFNYGLGIIVARKNLVLGISYDHINRPLNDYLPYKTLDPKLSMHVNYLIKCNKNTILIPAIVYQNQGDFNNYLPSLMLKYKHIKVGTAFNYFKEGADDLVLMIGFVNNFMSIGYSHDFYISKLASASGGAHEFSVVINFNCKKDKEKYGISQLYEF